MTTSADEQAAWYFVPTGENIHIYILVLECRGLGMGLLGQHQQNTRWKHTQKKHIPETPEGLLPGVQKLKTQEKEEPALRAPFRKIFLKQGET